MAKRIRGTAKAWESGKLGLSAKHARRASPEVEAAIQAAAAPQIWFDGPQGAGLHVLRTERGENRDYQVVRAVFINDGITQCYEMRWHGGGKIDMTEFTNPAFQKVDE
jgi:hypothetical protein